MRQSHNYVLLSLLAVARIGRLRGPVWHLCKPRIYSIGGDDGDADGQCDKSGHALALSSSDSPSESLHPVVQNSKFNPSDSGGGWPEAEALGDPGGALAVLETSVES